MINGDSWTIPAFAHRNFAAGDPGVTAEIPAAESSDQNRALLWGSLLTDCPDFSEQSPEIARAMLLEWWGESPEEICRKLSDFPELFRTTRFRKEIRFVESPLIAIKPAFDSLRAGESTLWETMDHLVVAFGCDREKLFRWKAGLQNLAGLMAWQRSLVQAHEYLMTAFTLGRHEIDLLRESLLRCTEETYRFLEAEARREFDERFAEFRKQYMETYYLLHEDALHIGAGPNKDEIKIDPVALRNLDLLSGLQHMDKRLLNRVKLLGKWVQRNQCHMPLRQILEKYPRCYCNFNPGSHQQPSDAAALINGTIQDSLEYFRKRLRRCGHLIMLEVQAQKVDDGALRPITALLGDGPMPALKPQTIKLLNRIIGKYPNEFLTEFRKK